MKIEPWNKEKETVDDSKKGTRDKINDTKCIGLVKFDLNWQGLIKRTCELSEANR